MNELQKKIYDRFVRYVSVETTSDPESTVTPTTQSQIEFAHLLAKEMKTVGLTDVEVDEYGFVTGLLPANSLRGTARHSLRLTQPSSCTW